MENENEIQVETEQPKWSIERACDYCGKVFAPTRPQDAQQKFCCANHRKDFFRYGAKLRIVAAVSRVFDGKLRQLEKRIAALEKKSSKPLDNRHEQVVTFKQEVNR